VITGIFQLALLAAGGWFGRAVALKAMAARPFPRPSLEAIGLGALTNFFDTLGIGSFATSTAYIRMRRLTADVNIPAVLNLGHALPSIAQAFIFIGIVKIDATLLLSCMAMAVIGAVVAAPVVAKLPVRVIQLAVGVALLAAALALLMTIMGLFPAGGTAVTLDGWRFSVAVAAHFVLGGLMTMGIGLYAPSLILLSLLGLDPLVAFPVMMGSCAFLMTVGGTQFLRTDRIDLPLIIGIGIGGVPAALAAALLVKSLPLGVLRWLVVAVVLYAAISLIHAACRRPGLPQSA
jgi:uncharacterized membrane protein YfcA